jgi:hypothetical protein
MLSPNGDWWSSCKQQWVIGDPGFCGQLDWWIEVCEVLEITIKKTLCVTHKFPSVFWRNGSSSFIHGSMYPLSPPLHPPQLDKQCVPIIVVRQVMGLLSFYFLTNIVELRIKKIITLTNLGYHLNKLGTSIMVDYQTSKKNNPFDLGKWWVF